MFFKDSIAWDTVGAMEHNQYTYLFLLLIEIVNNNTNKEIQGKERSEDDEVHKVEIHKHIVLHLRLLIFLQGGEATQKIINNNMGPIQSNIHIANHFTNWFQEIYSPSANSNKIGIS